MEYLEKNMNNIKRTFIMECITFPLYDVNTIPAQKEYPEDTTIKIPFFYHATDIGLNQAPKPRQTNMLLDGILPYPQQFTVQGISCHILTTINATNKAIIETAKMEFKIDRKLLLDIILAPLIQQGLTQNKLDILAKIIETEKLGTSETKNTINQYPLKTTFIDSQTMFGITIICKELPTEDIKVAVILHGKLYRPLSIGDQ